MVFLFLWNAFLLVSMALWLGMPWTYTWVMVLACFLLVMCVLAPLYFSIVVRRSDWELTWEPFNVHMSSSGVLLEIAPWLPSRFRPEIETVEDEVWELLPLPLPKDQVPASPVLKITPENVDYKEPVRLLVPCCRGASRVWRSTQSRWEEVEAVFGAGYLEVYLSHFCLLVAGQDPSAEMSVKLVCFWQRSNSVAKLVFLEDGCQKCDRALTAMQGHPEILGSFVRCMPEPVIQCDSDSHVRIMQNNQAVQSVQLGLGKPPQISKAIIVASSTSCEVSLVVDGMIRTYTFWDPSHSQSMSPSAPHRDVGRGTGSRRNPHVLRPGPLRSDPSRQRAQYRVHLMLSGRFNTDLNKTRIRDLNSALQQRGVPTFMVRAMPGDDFGPMTMAGLYFAKMMVAVCTNDYGEMTGAGYETYHELSYAWKHHLPIIPVRLCDPYPPEPPGDEGKAQNSFVLSCSQIYIDARSMSTEELADQINNVWLAS